MNEAKLIGRLKATQQEFALKVLMAPQVKDLFTYGQVSGVVIGIEQCINEIINQLKEERDGNDEL